MVKKKESKSVRTKKKLLEVALRLFSKDGFDETTMRDIAREADLSVGAAYYYFKTKDEFVLAFYEHTLEESLAQLDEIIAPHKDLVGRLEALMEHKFVQMEPFEKFISVIVRNAAEPNNPLSPFSTETKHIRDQAMVMVERLVDGSDLKVSKDLQPHLKKLLWFHHMGLIFFWIHDQSVGKKKSRALAKLSSQLLVRALRFTRYGVLTPLNKVLVQLMEILSALFEPDETNAQEIEF